jgi:soluble lytic murein transglycosylase
VRRRASWLATAGALGVCVLADASRSNSLPAWPDIDALSQRPGAALRRALVAMEVGDRDAAERLLVAVGRRHPFVADHADLLRMRLRIEEGRYVEAVALRDAWSHGDSPLQAEFQQLLGDAFVELGDELAARAAWVSALKATDDRERLAVLRLEIARSHRRTGDVAAAAEGYLEIWTRHPDEPADEEAQRELDDLEAVLGRTLRDAHHLRRRGDRLYRVRRNQEALEAYEAALASPGIRDSDARRARASRAYTLFRLRRYPEAADAFAGLPKRTDYRIERARAIARAGDVPRAVRQLDALRSSTRARLIAGLLLEGEGEGQAAREHYTWLVRRAPRSSHGTTALWHLGWQAYREGRYGAAMGYFEKLRGLESDPLDALRARYWRARAAERAGTASAEAFAAIAREYPLSYYGWRASARMGEGGDAPAEPVRLVRGTRALAPIDLARAEVLLEAGLDEAARDEMDRLFARARGLDDRLALADLYANAGDFHRPQRLVVDAYKETLARGPLPVPLELWWHAWPAPFDDQVRDATRLRAHVDPTLVYAVMREESGYRPRVLSVTGARGLLQLMPDTAERVARSVSMTDFAADDLFEPQVNITLGSVYLDQLLGQFSGHASAAIGGYNAGPHRVVRWLDGSALEDDEWVEAIPYNQTRSYVKRVLRSVHAYRVLY